MQQHEVKGDHRSRYAVAAGALLLVLIAAACGSSGGSKSAGANTSTTVSQQGSTQTTSGNSGVAQAQADVAKYSAEVTSYPAIPPVPGGIASLKGKSLWYVPLGGSLPIFQGFGVGIQEAATAAGMTLHTCDGKFVPTTMVSCLNQAASQGASAVIGGYIDYSEAPTAYDNLIANHIPVVIAGEPPSGGKSNSSHTFFYDASSADNLADQVALDSVIADSNGKAHILYMGISDTKSTLATANNTKDYVAKTCPACSFNLVIYNTASLSTVPSLASAALIRYPDTNFVVVEVDSGEPATIQGIQSAGFTNKVKLVAISGTLQPLQTIQSGGPQLSDVGLSPVYTGWQWTDAIVRMLKGQTPTITPSVTRIFTKDNVQSLTLTPAAYASNAWYGPDTFMDTFRKAWGVG